MSEQREKGKFGVHKDRKGRSRGTKREREGLCEQRYKGKVEVKKERKGRSR